jgi:hypothetical protein
VKPTLDEVAAHASTMQGILEWTALVCTSATYLCEPVVLADALEQVRTTDNTKLGFFAVPARRALEQRGTRALSQAVLMSEMAAIGFAHEQAKKFCDDHRLDAQRRALP